VFSASLPGTNALAQPSAIAVNSQGDAYVVGTAGGRMRTTDDAFQSTFGGSDGDAFLAELSTDGSELVYSSFLGGFFDDFGYGLALDSVGDVYVAGSTYSPNFPMTQNASQPAIDRGNLSGCGGPCLDAFLTKFPLGAPGGLSISSVSPTAGGNAGTVTPEIFGSGFHAGVSAELKCGGHSIPGTNATVGTMGRVLNATFDLTTLQPGVCDVVVTNPDGTSATSASAFAVQQGGAANVLISKVGTPAIGILWTVPRRLLIL